MTIEFTENAFGTQFFTDSTPFTFKSGAAIAPLVLAYETYGTLSPQKDNVILVHHSLSSNSHVHSHPKNPDAGWWEGMIGVGAGLDLSQFFIICINNIGSCGGSSGPTTVAAEVRAAHPYHFPFTTFEDMVRSQQRLLQALGINKLYAIVGYSMGSMISLTFAALFPEMCARLLVASTCLKAYPNNISMRMIQKNIITLDPNFDPAHSDDGLSLRGFHIARQLSMLTYRSPDELNERFLGKVADESIENYLRYTADKFIKRYHVLSYLLMLHAMDQYNLCTATAAIAWQQLTAKTLVIAVDTDILYPPAQQFEIYQTLKDHHCDVEYQLHDSKYGHDAFVLDLEDFSETLRRFLAV